MRTRVQEGAGTCTGPTPPTPGGPNLARPHARPAALHRHDMIQPPPVLGGPVSCADVGREDSAQPLGAPNPLGPPTLSTNPIHPPHPPTQALGPHGRQHALWSKGLRVLIGRGIWQWCWHGAGPTTPQALALTQGCWHGTCRRRCGASGLSTSLTLASTAPAPLRHRPLTRCAL